MSDQCFTNRCTFRNLTYVERALLHMCSSSPISSRIGAWQCHSVPLSSVLDCGIALEAQQSGSSLNGDSTNFPVCELVVITRVLKSADNPCFAITGHLFPAGNPRFPSRISAERITNACGHGL